MCDAACVDAAIGDAVDVVGSREWPPPESTTLPVAVAGADQESSQAYSSAAVA